MTALATPRTAHHLPEPAGRLRRLRAFHSYGFLFTGPMEHADRVTQLFAQQGVSCEVIGGITQRPSAVFTDNQQQLSFRDLQKQPLTGMHVIHKEV